jgi:hypothetical protein
MQSEVSHDRAEPLGIHVRVARGCCDTLMAQEGSSAYKLTLGVNEAVQGQGACGGFGVTQGKLRSDPIDGSCRDLASLLGCVESGDAVISGSLRSNTIGSDRSFPCVALIIVPRSATQGR